MVLVLLPVIN